jgi:biotin synthase-like enzyme
MVEIMVDFTDDFDKLVKKAGEVYNANFKPRTWFGRCIFLSWYCDVGTCEFCFRSTIKHKIKYASSAKRSKESIIVDAIIGKNCGWRIEFLTGGYRIFSFEEMVEICKIVSQVYEEKIWVNLGALSSEQMKMLMPYVEGVCASIETVEPELHNRICPDKKIEPYSEMLIEAGKLGLKKSATIVIGLGESKERAGELFQYIREHKLDRITFYALKPVNGTRFTASPEPAEYVWWIAMTRIEFPTLEIMAGLTPQNATVYAGLLLSAGANALTKFPAVKRFGTEQAAEIMRQAEAAGRKFEGSLTVLPDVDWNSQVDRLDIDTEMKKKVKEKLIEYIEGMRNGKIIEKEC